MIRRRQETERVSEKNPGNHDGEATSDSIPNAEVKPSGADGTARTAATSSRTSSRASESRGFGFVEMPNKDEAEKAIAALNGKDLKGRNLTVNEARPRTDRSRTGGGSRRY